MNGGASASTSFPATHRGAAAWEKWRPYALAIVTGILVSLAAAALIPIGAATVFRARRLYSQIARMTCIAILRLYGIRLRIHWHGDRGSFPRSQTIYISNHTSTLDLFVLVALGLPNTRFFLSGFLRKFVPLGVIGWMMGTFFTVPQDRPRERTRIFQRAERVLRRTGESVYLSPEGSRITTGEIGRFNKGAFHLATQMRLPITPFYIQIPPQVDPGRGYNAHPGVVNVDVLPAIDTSGWTMERTDENRAAVREMFVRVHGELRRGQP
jgi:1-acyl-sn-glycerol-3-phosphate acyltransferase